MSACPTDHQLDHLLAGEASAALDARFDEHLLACAECHERLTRRTAVPDAMRSALAPPAADDDVTRELLAAIRDSIHRP